MFLEQNGDIKSITAFQTESEARGVKEKLPEAYTVSVTASPGFFSAHVLIEETLTVRFCAKSSITSKTIQGTKWIVKRVKYEEENYDLHFRLCEIYGLAKLDGQKKVISGTGIALIEAFNSVGVTSFGEEKTITTYLQADLKKFRENLHKNLTFHAAHLNLTFSEEKLRRNEHFKVIETAKHFAKLKENKENNYENPGGSRNLKRRSENELPLTVKKFKYQEERNMESGTNWVDLRGEFEEIQGSVSSSDKGFVEDIRTKRKKLIGKNTIPKRSCRICKRELTLCKVDRPGSEYKGHFFFTCNRVIESHPLKTCSYSEYLRAEIQAKRAHLKF